MEAFMNNSPYHSSSALFSPGLMTKTSLAASSSCGSSITLPPCCPGATTTSLCCSDPGSSSASTPAYSEIQSESPRCLDCDSSSTPPQSLPICVPRIYPSPPLTGSALKKSVPLPELSGGPVMGSVCLTAPRSPSPPVMSHDGAASVAPLDLDLRPALEPLSPPPTVAVTTHALPEVDLGFPPLSQPSRDSSPRLPSPTDDEAPLPPSKRLRRERHEIYDDSSFDSSPIAPKSLWGYRSEASDSASTSHSFYDHDSTSSHWNSDSPEMEFSPHSIAFDGTHPPTSPRPEKSSLDLPPLPGFTLPYSNYLSDEYSLPGPSHARPSSAALLWFEQNPYDTDMAMDPPPQRTKSFSSHAVEPEYSYTDTVMPTEEEAACSPPAAPPPSGRLKQSLPDHGVYQDLLYLTPAPRSPHASLSDLPDLDMDDIYEAPSSPHSPHTDLPELLDDNVYSHPSATISPSLLSSAIETPNEGLGLFIQSDPPLRRSPSPEDDVLQFLDIQLDPATSNLDVDEFLALRALRKRTLDAEREARLLEADLNERVSEAATALLPSSLAEAGVLDDLTEKRRRKHELHVALDLRNEARKDRKREKQKSKEIGTLLDYKMNGADYASGLGFDMGDVKQLVASMMMRRREASRSLANRKSAASPHSYSRSSLSSSISSEDLYGIDMDTE